MPNRGKNHKKLIKPVIKNFLSASWEYLAMFNYEVDPSILKKHIPPHTEIDFFNGKALVSIVGFLFNNTKVLGVKWPFHINFEEVNLRYYIKRKDNNEWKRGVGFVSEIVPKPIVAGIANFLYNEKYSASSMGNSIVMENDMLSVSYKWKKNRWNEMQVRAKNELLDIKEASEEEFILEHYYGYNEFNKKTTIEYKVQHPRWQIFPVIDFKLDCDVEKLYGKEFVPFIMNKKPVSVFLARGSAVTVKMPKKIRG